MDDYEPIKIEVLKGDWPKRAKQQEALFSKCPSMKFYLKPMLDAYLMHDQGAAEKIILRWEQSAPRPVQRIEALRWPDEIDHGNVILFGKESGTGKTTVAMELIWRGVATWTGMIQECDYAPPIAITGHAFARRVAAESLTLDALMREFFEADFLLLDDLDKRGDREGKFSPSVQQAIFDLIEDRTTRGVQTFITLNASGNELLEKFDDSIGQYLLRRLRERFRSIDFDPELPASNIVQIQQSA